MNREEWKSCSDRKLKWQWANKCRKIQRSLQYNKNPKAVVRHHLRDTEEQRKYNDEHYEYFGFNQDGTFEYGKYIIFVTKEEHSSLHSVSEETRKKRSKSLKGIHKTEEWRKKLSKSNKGKHYCSDEQRKQLSESAKNYYTLEGSREKTSSTTKEAMWRPDVRQRLLDGCKKRPPISNEVRQRASEANRVRPISNEDTYEFISYFVNNNYTDRLLSIKELSYIFSAYKESHSISWNTFQKLYKNVKRILLHKEIILV